MNIERNDECIVCGKKGSAVLCDSCTKQYKERRMLNRNYRVYTGSELEARFQIKRINGRDLEKDQLFGMLFVADPENKNAEFYGPFFDSPEAQRWCDNLNKLFKELRNELGE